MRKKARRLSAILVSIILYVTLVSTTGCFHLYDVRVSSVSFTSNVITLAVGERTELNEYVKVSPRTATNKSFTATVADEAIVTAETDSAAVIPRITLVGLARGETTVTVRAQGGVTASARVVVTYAPPSALTIRADASDTMFDGAVILTDPTKTHTVRLYADLADGTDPDTRILWQAESEESGRELPCDEPFVFQTTGAGIKTVTASVANAEEVYDRIDVYVSDAVTGATVSYDARYIEQTAGQYHTVSFSLSYDALPEGNPAPRIVWYVGETAAGRGTQFDYTPSVPGIFAVSAYINGERVATDAGEEVKILVRGVITPQNVWVDYDDCYPYVIIRWDKTPSAAGYEIRITDADTGRAIGSDIRSDNIGISRLFTDESFDASAYMTGKKNIFSNRFTVCVKTLGDESGILLESDWSNLYTTSRLPAAAERYLASKFYDGARNRYVRSYEEFYEWFTYAMLWRPSSLETGEKLYLDYNFESAAKTIDRAMQQAHFTGKYSYGGATLDGDKRICTFEISFLTVGTPSKRTDLHTSEAWGSMRPHICYDAANMRSVNDPFAIDARTPVSVETSDQLYYMAQSGYAPKPVRGSAADRLYEYARRVLRHIVTPDMTDAQKVHAIYDWIMWRVKYDDRVIEITDLEESVKYEAYYLESVFADGNTYGVCDAMSKAFVLMCRIEGIEAIRVTGRAGNTASTRGGHAWNKVKLGDDWYVCDCTWGDVSLQIMSGGAYREAATHAYLLISDAEIAQTHIEDEGTEFPAADKGRYRWYDESVPYGDTSLDILLEYTGSESGLQSKLSALAKEMKRITSAAGKSYTVAYTGGSNRTTSDYYAFELVVANRWTEGSVLSASPFDRALTMAMRLANCPRGSYYTSSLKIGNYTHYLIFMRSDSFLS